MNDPSFIQVAEDGTGKKMRTVTDQVGADVVHTELIAERPEFSESARQIYERGLLEQMVLLLTEIRNYLSTVKDRTSLGAQ